MDASSPGLDVPQGSSRSVAIRQIAAAEVGGRSREVPRSLKRLACVGTLGAADLVIVHLAQAFAAVALPAPAELVAIIPSAFFSVFAFLAAGLYTEWGMGPVERLRARGIGVALFSFAALLVLGAGERILTDVIVGQVALAAILIVPLGFYASEAVRALLVRAGFWGVPTALIGTGPHSIALAHALLARPEYGLDIVGFIDTDSEWDERRNPDLPLPVIGRSSEADRLSRRIRVVLVAARDPHASSDLLRLPFAHVVLAHWAANGPTSCLKLRSLCDGFGFDVPRGIFRRRNLLVKRCLDCSFGIPLLIIASPVMLLIALAIKLASPGPVFFRQARTGMDGKVIEVLKFRTMYVDADARLKAHLASNAAARAQWDAFFKLQDDPRVIPRIGRLLRKYSLDELPQLINVVLGHISLVGPRPFPAYHMQGFDEDFRRLRASVPPGLTGFWQISARSNGDLAVQKAQDTYYIQNWSVWLDFYILLRTPITVAAARGAC